MPKPIPTITVVNWGRPGVPMVIVVNGSETASLEPHTSKTTLWDGPCIEYATQPMRDVPAHLQPAPKALHLGFYGYLRACNLICLAKSGVSIFDLSDQTWRDWYDDQIPPAEAVDEALADNGFPSSDELDED